MEMVHMDVRRIRNIDTSASEDVHGRENRIDIYAGKEAFELYKKLFFNKMPPL
ncbi:MAG: hypothetical protein SAMD01599839_02830 [Rectinema sp.]